MPPHFCSAPDQSLALDDPDIAQSDRAAHRMAGIGGGMHEFAVRRRALDRLMHAFGGDHAAQRQIAARYTLGERDEVGLDTPMTEREPSPGAAEPGDHLVGDQ